MKATRWQWRLIPQLDRYPKLVALAQRPSGKSLIVAVAFLLGYPMAPKSSMLYIAPCLLAISLFPKFRKTLILLATLGSALGGLTYLDALNVEFLPIFYGVGEGWSAWWVTPGFALVFLLFCWAMVALARRTAFFPLQKNPAWTAIGLLVGGTLPLTYLSLPPLIEVVGWSLFLVGTKYIWFLAYSLQEAKSPDQPPFSRQLSFYQPFWYPSPVPIPKGASYLASIECHDEQDFAICQLKGLKLLMWAMVLNGMVFFIEGFLYGEGKDLSERLLLQWNAGQMQLLLDGRRVASLWYRDFVGYFPPLDFALSQIASGGPVLSPARAWGSTVTFFLMDLAGLAAITHAGIAFCRLAGFKALRNVYRPLEATSVADFWNRYYYYYKELLVTVFFYPSYFSLFRNSPGLRLFTATLLAAGFGNTLFHVFLDSVMIIDRGILGALAAYHTFAFYGLVLACGIFFSQRKRSRRAVARTRFHRALVSIRVILFYCVTIIFADVHNHDIRVNFKFFLSLFGVS